MFMYTLSLLVSLTSAYAFIHTNRFHRHYLVLHTSDINRGGVNNASEEIVDNGASSNNNKNTNDINMGTTIGWQGVGNMLFNEELQKSGRVDLGVGSSNTYKDFRGNDIVPKIDPAVKQWLFDTLPSLDKNDDLELYSEQLTRLGFHPDECPSMCEISYEDLDFMKVLHRRYFYTEITGQEHPFEP